jgi:hypothetical protein
MVAVAVSDTDPFGDIECGVVGDMDEDPVWLGDLLFEAVFDTVALINALTDLLPVVVGEPVHVDVRD